MYTKFIFSIFLSLVTFSSFADVPITNGSLTTIEDNPHCASIFVNGTFTCTASILNNKWLIGAAHCFKSVSTDPTSPNLALSTITVKLGVTDKTSSDGEMRGIVSTVFSPSYGNTGTTDSDFILIELDCPIVFSDKIQPIKVAGPGITQVDQSNTVVGITGWGLDEDGNIVNQLRTAGTFIRTLDEILDEFQFPSIPEPLFSLFSYGPDNKNACSGDSGGPMTYYNNAAAENVLVGIISQSIFDPLIFGCENNATIYADLRPFKSFIENNIKQTTEITQNTTWN